MMKFLANILVIPIAVLVFGMTVLGYVVSFLVDFLSILVVLPLNLLTFPLGFIFGFGGSLLHDKKKRW